MSCDDLICEHCGNEAELYENPEDDGAVWCDTCGSKDRVVNRAAAAHVDQALQDEERRRQEIREQLRDALDDWEV